MPERGRNPRKHAPGPGEVARARRGRRMAIIRGQDRSRWTDFYHAVLTVPWPLFLLALALFFFAVNVVFALLYMVDPGGIENARPGYFWDAFLFSVQTIASIGYGVLSPKSTYANVIVVVEAFTGILNLALITGVVFARFSRPTARVLFSNVAVVTMFEGVPTLMFRAANQRGNQILDANITVSLAHEVVTTEGIAMRRFEELKLVRSRTPLFALSWTVMHRINETSPLYGATSDSLTDDQVEIVALLSGTDETLADTIYARQAYTPQRIHWSRRFVDVLGVTQRGLRVVDLNRFHDTEADPVISAP